jgi:hypothetical protein
MVDGVMAAEAVEIVDGFETDSKFTVVGSVTTVVAANPL